MPLIKNVHLISVQSWTYLLSYHFVYGNFTEFYEASIRYDRSLDSVPIVTVSATDKDSGDAGTVEYELQEASSVFGVGSSDGGIRLISSPESGR